MEFLYCLLDESNVHERVMKAELARELGRFQEAISLLQYGFESDQRKFVDTIKKLAQEQNQIVTEVKMN